LRGSGFIFVVSLAVALMPVAAAKLDDDVLFKSRADSSEPTYSFRKADVLGIDKEFWGRFDLNGNTGWNRLYLFPDGHVVYTVACDICPEEVIAKGRYKLNKGSISLVWKTRNKKFVVPTRLTALYGQDEMMSGEGEGAVRVISGSKYAVLEEDELKLAVRGDSYRYFERVTPFHDWKAIHRRLDQSGSRWTTILAIPDKSKP
jgi:hypothetical protein